MRTPTRDEMEAKLLANRSIEDRGYRTRCWIWTMSCQPHGYGQTSFGVRNGRPRNVRVHRVAALIWLGFDIESDLKVLHHCDVPRCFNPHHLFVGTPHDNTQDMMTKGRNAFTTRYGESVTNHVLTETEVRTIRRLAANSGAPRGFYKETAKAFGVSDTLIWKIVHRQAWPHLD